MIPQKERANNQLKSMDRGYCSRLRPELKGPVQDAQLERKETKRDLAAKFGPFELNLTTRELRRDGVTIRLQSRPFQIVTALLEQPGRVVTREELRYRLWPSDTFVDFESGLNTAANRLRTALGDSADAPVYVETLAKAGYRFLAPVTFHEAEPGTVSRPDSAMLPGREAAETSPAKNALPADGLHRVGFRLRGRVLAAFGVVAAVVLAGAWLTYSQCASQARNYPSHFGRAS